MDYEIKYPFHCWYKDGSMWMQPQDDISLIKEGTSAFYDVLQREDELSHFGLCANVDGEWRPFCAVNLQDGSFELNGAQFWPQDMSLIPWNGEPLRLVYYRQIARQRRSGQELLHVRYYLGWQTTIDGKNYKSILGFD